MEQKELNLCEILKDCPKGTRLYSPMLGEVYFNNTESIGTCNICVYKACKSYHWFTFDGRFALSSQTFSEEMMLFPSKDNRDWNTFKPKKERFDPKTLKPFDKVLVRTNSRFLWKIDFFGYVCSNEEYPYCCSGGYLARFCIPYNDETAHLVGTTDDAPEYYKWWE